MSNTRAQELINFINDSSTPYMAIKNLKKMLNDAGGREIKLSELNDSLSSGKLYYTTYEDLCLAAFIKGDTLCNGLKLAASHIDHPVLKIKPCPSKTSNDIERLSVEIYGSTINHTWVDRPLKLAGRVCFLKQDGQIDFADIDSEDHTVVIPSAALHVVRDVNENAKFSVQNELLPFFSSKRKDNTSEFLNWLSQKTTEVTQEKITSDSILSFDISLIDAFPAAFSGINNEFISAPGLDDLAMTYTIFKGLCENVQNTKNAGVTSPVVAFAFNHEECGSLSNTGARSSFTKAVTSAICKATDIQANDLTVIETMEKSIAYSCDMAHATHPSYEGKSDPEHKIIQGHGLVLKTSQNQAYSTSVLGCAQFVATCKKASLPYQIYAGHSDTRTGSTIGPMLCADLGIRTVDIGIPMLSMHSAREFCFAEDILYAVKFFTTLFSQQTEG